MNSRPHVSRSVILRLVAALAAVSVTAVGVSLATGERPAAAGSVNRSTGATQDLTVAAPTRRAYSVFSSASAAPPSAASETLRIQRGATAGSESEALDPASIRAAYSDARGAVHVGAGPELVCLSVRETSGSGSLGCTTVTSASDPNSPLISVDYLGEKLWRVSGLLQDGVRSASISTAGGTRHAVSVQNNVFSMVVAAHPDSVRWADEASVREEELGRTPDRGTAPPG